MLTNQSKLRMATINDLDALLHIERRCFAHSVYKPHRFDQRQFRYYLNQPRAYILIQEQGQKVVGYILGIIGTGTRAHIARIYSLAVQPDFRCKGLGTALLRKFIALVRKHDCTSIILEVAVRNKNAQTLFQRLGFQIQGRLENYYGHSKDALRMRLMLEQSP